MTKASIEKAAADFLALGVGDRGEGCVIIRSGALGAFILTKARGGQWIDAFYTDKDSSKIVDVTGKCPSAIDASFSETGIPGAGNSFLGGLAAGLLLAGGDVYKGMHLRNHREMIDFS